MIPTTVRRTLHIPDFRWGSGPATDVEDSVAPSRTFDLPALPKTPVAQAPRDGRGLAVVCIDGLSYPTLRYALQAGKMPNLARMLASDHSFQSFFPGIPCTTPASMCGFTLGDNSHIPSYTWYDKATGRQFNAGNFKDFEAGYEGPARDAGHPGLVSNGSLYSCLASGGTKDSHFSVDVMGQRHAQGGLRAVLGYVLRDMGKFALHHPALMARALGQYGHDVVRNFKDSYNGKNGDFLPEDSVGQRVGEALSTAVETGLLGLPATAGVEHDMAQGKPAIFVDLAIYDGTAHAYGPRSKQAMKALQRVDHDLGRLLRQAGQGRGYEVAIISDHGQTEGVSFKDRYGTTVGDYVQDLARATVPDETVAEGLAGPLANLYFTSDKQQLQLGDVQSRYPGLVDKLVLHPGVGLVVARQGGATWVFGRDGQACIQDGKVQIFGHDILSDTESSEHKVADQLAHLAAMPNSGDLIVLGQYLGHDQVMSFEHKPQPGAHGGLGGGENQAIFVSERHRDLDASSVTNSSQMYHVLSSMLPT